MVISMKNKKKRLKKGKRKHLQMEKGCERLNSIYLGDIDPNNNMISPIEIRRNFMHKLLIFDSIVLSDSQLLTDPRINLMMARFDSKEYAKKWGMADIDDFYKGFEQLINNGFVEVACREKNKEKSSLSTLYYEMSHRTSKVPYLPEREDYSNYLDSLTLKVRPYDLDSISNRFRTNLLRGIGSKRFRNTTNIEHKVSELFYEDKINFSTILALLTSKRKSGEIGETEYNRIYKYVYSCYSINISAETGCYISTAFKDMPLHLDCGTGNLIDTVGPPRFDNMRPTWALIPNVLDHISFEDFVSLKKGLVTYFNQEDRKVLMDYFDGKKNNFDRFYDVWDKYTRYLEESMDTFLLRRQLQIYEELSEMSGVKIEQKTYLSGSYKLIVSLAGCVPGIGTPVSGASALMESLNYIKTLSYREQWNNLLEEYYEIEKLLSPDTRIITKYPGETDNSRV